MLRFGTSAFLKLVCQNARPQRRTIRDRVRSSGDGGYDFHRSLRRLARRMIVGGEPLASIDTSIEEITRDAERRSARAGMERLDAWRRDHRGEVCEFASATYESPAGLFSVAFTPDFGVRVGRREISVHVWNTINPPLQPHLVSLALSLFPPLYEGASTPDDLAVLSLRDSEFYRLSEAGARADEGEALATRIDELIRDVRDELGLPDADEHPPGPRA